MRKAPKQILDLLKHHKILFSQKAQQQLDLGNFDTHDLLHSILHGKIIKKEKDEKKKAKYKYTIIGPSRTGYSIYSCGKIVKLLEKTYFVITFHEVR